MKKCVHFNRGYCRSKEYCLYLHPKDHCLQKECDKKQCKDRHIKDCKRWSNRGCRFGDLCEFRHDRLKKSTCLSEMDTILALLASDGAKNTTPENNLNRRVSEKENDDAHESSIEEMEHDLIQLRKIL